MFLDAIPAGRNPSYEVNVFIEIPIGGEPIKYEWIGTQGSLPLTGFFALPCANYGFIPHTLSGRRRSL